MVIILPSYCSQADIIGGPLLDAWRALHANRLNVVHVLSREDDATWEGERGHVSQALIAQHCPAPSEDSMVFVCGPPAMYQSLCGPRGEPELSGVLAQMGHMKSQVFKF